MAERDLRQIIDPDWAAALEPVAGRIAAMGDFLREEIAAGRRYLPAGENVLRAFSSRLVRCGCSSWGRTRIPRRATPWA